MKKVLILFLSIISCILGGIILDTLQMAMTGIILIVFGIGGSLTSLFLFVWEGADL